MSRWNKRAEQAERIAKLLRRKNLIEIDEDGEPMVSIDVASTGSVYATYYLNNGSFDIRLSDHKPNMDCGVYWAKTYTDAKATVFAAALR